MFHKVIAKPVNLLLLISSAVWLQAAEPTWLDSVAPLLTSSQKKLYLSMKPEERASFERDFWIGKAVTAEEYFQRLAYIDANFGSNRTGSGVNTDRGRVYLSLGPPTRAVRIPSSRIFVPLEIWYYDAVPAIQLKTELRLIFYQPRSIGFPKLYSPTLDTIRALLLPQASVVGLFGPNDEISEATIRTTLNVSSVEDEIISAAVNVASGVKYSGNDEILGQITSPMEILAKQPQIDVQSRFIVARPKLYTLRAPSPNGGVQLDLSLETAVRRELDLEVMDGPIAVYGSRLRFGFSSPEPLRYSHRIDLLPGQYRILFTVDGTPYPYAVDVPDHATMSPIFRADETVSGSGRHTPFEFDGRHLEPNPEGSLAVVTLAQRGKVTWMVRRGMQAVWRSTSEGTQAAILRLPFRELEPGTYRLEAIADTGSQSCELVVQPGVRPMLTGTSISFNANLSPALRLASIGHQWLLRGNLAFARQSIEASLGRAPTSEAQVELARLDALEGRLDVARDSIRKVLTAEPNNFEALSVFAYIEARFQDYPVAAELYRRALAVQDSPTLRLALAKLPQ